MINRIIQLEYGSIVRTIAFGPGVDPNLRNCTVTQCVNSGDELTIGSVCSACAEATIQSKTRPIQAGQAFNLIEFDASGVGTVIGRFRIKTSDKKGTCLYKITAFDAVAELDINLASWLLSLDWSQNYTLREFASMVCTRCGVTLTTQSFPNDDFIVSAIYDKEATGRKLLRWCAEIAGRYCRAGTDGSICFDWYTYGNRPTILATGDNYYFSGSLSYGEYDCLPVDAVVVQQTDGTLWPERWGADEIEYSNPYIIKDNLLLLACPDDEHRLGALAKIKDVLDALPQYRSCKVSCPAHLGISVGDILDITDSQDFRFQSLVMSKVRSGQKDTLECYGSYKRQN